MKQGQLIKGLRAAYLKLVAVKRSFPPGPDREYEPSVVEAKQQLTEWFFRAHEHGLDPTGMMVQLSKLV